MSLQDDDPDARHERKMQEARAKVIYKAPYFSSIVYGFVFQAVPGIRTMLVTNKLVLGYDPAWANEASVDALAADIVHEVNHFVRRHFERAERVDNPKLWNIAGDLAINPDLRTAHWQLDKSAIFPEDFDLPEGKTTEEYYELLQQMAQGGGGVKKKKKGDPTEGGGEPSENGQDEEGEGGGGGVAAGHCGGIGGHSHNPDIEAELNAEPGLGRDEQEVRAIAARAEAELKAHAESHGRGSIPSSLHELLKKFDQESCVRWQDELSVVMHDATGRLQLGGEDFSLVRPSKRSIMRGVVRPSMVEYLPEVAIIRDSSGSMGAAQLTRAACEAYAIVQTLGIDEVWFVDADTDISLPWQRVGPEFFRELTDAYGRGGTSFIKPLESAQQLTPYPDILVYITDGDGYAPPAPPPNMTVIWCVVPNHYNRAPADWGHVVIVSEDVKARNRPVLRPSDVDDDSGDVDDDDDDDEYDE